MDNKEMNLNEMESVVGGAGGSSTPLPKKDGFEVYKILPGNTLTRIANKFHTTVDYLVLINPSITDRNDITAGRYMYVPKQK